MVLEFDFFFSVKFLETYKKFVTLFDLDVIVGDANSMIFYDSFLSTFWYKIYVPWNLPLHAMWHILVMCHYTLIHDSD